MTLATKNGSLIVKDGSIAENCGCCGGWYCCPDVSTCQHGLRAVVTVTAHDYTMKYSRAAALWKENLYVIGGTTVSQASVNVINGAALAGTFQVPLTFFAVGSGYYYGTMAYPADDVGCSGAELSVGVYSNKLIVSTSFSKYTWHEQNQSDTPPSFKLLGDMKCDFLSSYGNTNNAGGNAYGMYLRYAPGPSNNPFAESNIEGGCLPVWQSFEMSAKLPYFSEFDKWPGASSDYGLYLGGTESLAFVGSQDIVFSVSIEPV